VRGAVRRELRDSFYDTRRLTHSHEAIDIMAPRNTPILAVEDGSIARLFESKAGGTAVYQFDPTTRYVISTPISSATLTGSKRAITFNAGRCSATSALPATCPKVCPTRARTVLYSGRWAVRAAEVPF
jgi:hypothetical protein